MKEIVVHGWWITLLLSTFCRDAWPIFYRVLRYREILCAEKSWEDRRVLYNATRGEDDRFIGWRMEQWPMITNVLSKPCARPLEN